MKPFRAAVILSLIASPALAQSARGTWEGAAYTGNSSQKVTVVLDSVATGWKGTVVSSMGPEAVPLVTVTLKADTLSFGIPYNGATVWIQGLVAGSKFSGSIWVGNDNAGTMELTKKGAEADKPSKP
jgi:hypothetical protein